MTRDELFDIFWASYPWRVHKGTARKAFAAIPMLEFDAIMDGLEKAKRYNPQWRKDAGTFIPHAATWLRAEGWLDEYEITLPKLQPQRPAEIDRCEWEGCEAYAVHTDLKGRNKRCSEHVYSKVVV